MMFVFVAVVGTGASLLAIWYATRDHLPQWQSVIAVSIVPFAFLFGALRFMSESAVTAGSFALGLSAIAVATFWLETHVFERSESRGMQVSGYAQRKVVYSTTGAVWLSIVWSLLGSDTRAVTIAASFVEWCLIRYGLQQWRRS